MGDVAMEKPCVADGWVGGLVIGTEPVGKRMLVRGRLIERERGDAHVGDCWLARVFRND